MIALRATQFLKLGPQTLVRGLSSSNLPTPRPRGRRTSSRISQRLSEELTAQAFPGNADNTPDHVAALEEIPQEVALKDAVGAETPAQAPFVKQPLVLETLRKLKKESKELKQRLNQQQIQDELQRKQPKLDLVEGLREQSLRAQGLQPQGKKQRPSERGVSGDEGGNEREREREGEGGAGGSLRYPFMDPSKMIYPGGPRPVYPPGVESTHDKLIFERYGVYPQPAALEEFLRISKDDVTSAAFDAQLNSGSPNYLLARAFLPPPPPFRYLPFPPSYFEHLEAFEKKFELVLSSRILLLQAFAHESYLSFFLPPQLKPKVKGIASMRLGMIGDIVLDLQISRKVFERNHRITTGEATVAMHQMRANKELAKAAHASLGFDHLVLAKPGVDKFTKVFSTTIEALVGAVYVDKGFEEATAFVEKHVVSHLFNQQVEEKASKSEGRAFNMVNLKTEEE